MSVNYYLKTPLTYTPNIDHELHELHAINNATSNTVDVYQSNNDEIYKYIAAIKVHSTPTLKLYDATDLGILTRAFEHFHSPLDNPTPRHKWALAATGIAMAGGMLALLLRAIKTIPRPGARVLRTHDIAVIGPRVLQNRVTDFTLVLQQYTSDLYKRVAQSYTMTQIVGENEVLLTRIAQYRSQLTTTMASMMFYRTLNDMLVQNVNVYDQLSREIQLRDQTIRVLKTQQEHLKSMILQKHREQIETIQENTRSEHTLQLRIKHLEDQVLKYKSYAKTLEQSLQHYLDEVIKAYRKSTETIGSQTDINDLFNSAIIDGIPTDQLTTDSPYNSFFQPRGKLWDAILAGSMGTIIGTFGAHTYMRDVLTKTGDRLSFALTSIDLLEADKQLMTNYIDTLHARMEVESLMYKAHKNNLLKKIEAYQTNTLTANTKISQLENEIQLLKSDQHSVIESMRNDHALKLRDAAQHAEHLGSEMASMLSDARDIHKLSILSERFNDVRLFLRDFNQFIGKNVLPYTEVMESFRKIYGYTINSKTKQHSADIIRYLDVIEVLANNSLDNLYYLTHSNNYSEFVHKMDLSQNLLNSIILKPPLENPIAQIQNHALKTKTYLERVQEFFVAYGQSFAISAGIASIFIIGRSRSSIFQLLGAFATYIARFLLGVVKDEIIVQIKYMVIDAIIWALKTVYKQARHIHSSVYRYIENMVHGQSDAYNDSISLSDPVISFAATYIDNVINGGVPYEGVDVKLPFNVDRLNARKEITSDGEFDDMVNKFLDKLGTGAKDVISRKSNGVIRNFMAA